MFYQKRKVGLHEKVSGVSEARSGTGLFSHAERCVRFEALARGVFGVRIFAAVREPRDIRLLPQHEDDLAGYGDQREFCAEIRGWAAGQVLDPNGADAGADERWENTKRKSAVSDSTHRRSCAGFL